MSATFDKPTYEEIIALRDITDDQRRGYLFETAMREVMPWVTRPPLAVVGESEQLDAFFEWNSWHFVVESKAKRGIIKRGSHDWEDFELKVRKRRGSCIGLFCSLFPASDDLYAAAEQLNREGLCTLLLTGSFWEELAAHALAPIGGR
jgi:hypothetical protein